ncbi:MAG: glycosyltransferase family 4 protein [Candidatus Omnitrophota bacterium]
MRILQLTTHMDYGGIPTYVANLSKALAHMGHKPLVVSAGGTMLKELDKAGISHIEISLQTKSELSPKVLLSLYNLCRIIRTFKPDIIHSHTRVTQVISHLVSKLTGVAYITTCHGFFRPRHFRKFFPCWGRRVIAISSAIKNHLNRDFSVPAERIRVIHTGIDLKKFEKAPSAAEKQELKSRLGITGCEIVGIMARLSSVKGHEYLLRAVKILAPKRKHLKLLIIGDGPQKRDVKNEIQRLQLDNTVVLMESTAFTSVPLSIMDVFVLPTVQEGLGLSLIEAMAAGIPTVASKVGGVLEVIDDGKTGMLVPAKDPGALAEAIEFLLDNKARADAMADEAKKAVFEKFNLYQMAEKILKVYKEICV